MSTHVTIESLSAYLDRELPEAQERRVEAHLDDCPRCREECDSLSRVVHRLQRLERVAPPTLLAGEVARRVALDRRPKSLLERLESRLSGQPFQSQLFNTFALVMALASILYVFAYGLDLLERRRIPVRVASPEASQEFNRQHEIAIGMRSEVGNRVFRMDGDSWREEGAVGEPETVLAATSAEGLAVQERHPELEVLLGRGQPVILNDGGRVVKVLVE